MNSHLKKASISDAASASLFRRSSCSQEPRSSYTAPKQRDLAAEVVVPRALRDPGPLDDVLDRGGGIALLGEPLAGDGDEVLAGGRRLAFP